MTWVVRQYSKTRIDKAGEVLVQPEQAAAREEALEVINNWRSSHAFPLNTMQMALRRIARQVDHQPIVAQRIKRLSSIELKLRRFPTMTLSQMQDLGGCRAIVSDLQRVFKMVEHFRRSRMKHKHTIDNYIEAPQQSGYRGVHLIWRYYSDRSSTYNGQKIEMQLRSALQHSWATAVETVGTFTRHALKSSIGPERWLRFFVLMGTVMAVREGTNRVAATPADTTELLAELREIVAELDVVKRLETYGAALQYFSSNTAGDAHYFLIHLDTENQRTLVTGFKAGELKEANTQYLALERKITSDSPNDAVLVSVENIALLERAYPNYFLDTRAFLEVVREVLPKVTIRQLRTRRRARARPANKG